MRPEPARTTPRPAVAPAQLIGRAATRGDEVDDVAALLMAHASTEVPRRETRAFAVAIALACLGDRHLWEDLGLSSRAALGELMRRHFPSLVELNVRGMRWKKFLYRQLCLQEEVLICRSPSCAVCEEESVCFGPEEAGTA